VAFLQEAKDRLAGRADAALGKTLTHYQRVAQELGRVSEIYPWTYEASDEETVPIDEQSRTAAEALRAARKAEADGLDALRAIVEAL
jgi:hypothetical protein